LLLQESGNAGRRRLAGHTGGTRRWSATATFTLLLAELEGRILVELAEVGRRLVLRPADTALVLLRGGHPRPGGHRARRLFSRDYFVILLIF
jgi:hypothetical protein